MLGLCLKRKFRNSLLLRLKASRLSGMTFGRCYLTKVCLEVVNDFCLLSLLSAVFLFNVQRRCAILAFEVFFVPLAVKRIRKVKEWLNLVFLFSSILERCVWLFWGIIKSLTIIILWGYLQIRLLLNLEKWLQWTSYDLYTRYFWTNLISAVK